MNTHPFLKMLGSSSFPIESFFGGKPAENFNANAPDLPKFSGVAIPWNQTGRGKNPMVQDRASWMLDLLPPFPTNRRGKWGLEDPIMNGV